MLSERSKENTKAIIGTSGTREILKHLSESDLNRAVPTVAIGGINASNVQRVLYQSQAPGKRLDGVAVVSAVMGAEDPTKAASELRSLITARGTSFAPRSVDAGGFNGNRGDDSKLLCDIIKQVRTAKPLCHNMTNLVVQNFAANVALSM